MAAGLERGPRFLTRSVRTWKPGDEPRSIALSYMSHLPALLNLVGLANLPRTGWLLAGVQVPESVAAHANGVALLALALGAEVEDLDVDRAVALAAVHDAPEVELTDLPRRTKALFDDGALRAAETRAADRALVGLPLARARFEEYREQATREARFARACDRLQLGLQALAYRRAGHAGLDEFLEGVAALDLAEFPPCARLQADLVEAWRGSR